MYGVNGMFKYIMRNILMIIPTVLGVVFIVFTINQFTPGDPVILMLGADYTQEQYDETAAELGVDQPFFTQFFNYLKNIITKFDFGTSYSSKRPVMDEIAGRFSVSLKLGLLSCLVSVMIGVPLGIVSATEAVFGVGLFSDSFGIVLFGGPEFLAVHDAHSALFAESGVAAGVGPDELEGVHHPGDSKLCRRHGGHYPPDPLQHA